MFLYIIILSQPTERLVMKVFFHDFVKENTLMKGIQSQGYPTNFK